MVVNWVSVIDIFFMKVEKSKKKKMDHTKKIPAKRVSVSRTEPFIRK